MITLILELVIIGVVLYIIEKYVPMDAAIKMIIRGVVIVLVLLWLLQLFGVVAIPFRVR